MKEDPSHQWDKPNANSAKVRRAQRHRAAGRKVEWLIDLLQATKGHHSSDGPRWSDLFAGLDRLQNDVHNLGGRVAALELHHQPECTLQRAPAAETRPDANTDLPVKPQADDVGMPEKPQADDGEEPEKPQVDDGGKLSAAAVPAALQQEDAMVVGVTEEQSTAPSAPAAEASSGHSCTKEDLGISDLSPTERFAKYSAVDEGNFEGDPLGHYLATCRLDNEPPNPDVMACLAPASPAASPASAAGGWQRNSWHSSWHQGRWHGWHNT